MILCRCRALATYCQSDWSQVSSKEADAPGGTRSAMRLLFRTRPSPPQVLHGVERSPAPSQSGHVITCAPNQATQSVLRALISARKGITRIKYPHCGVRSLKWRSTSACRLPQAAPFQTDGRDAIAVRPQLSALAIECVFAYNEQQKRSCDTLHTALSCAGSTVWVWPSQQAPQRWFDTRVGWGVHLLEHTQGCADCLNHLA